MRRGLRSGRSPRWQTVAVGIVTVVWIGCHAPATAGTAQPAPQRPAPRVAVEQHRALPGLDGVSGLCRDGAGRLWAVPERVRRLLQMDAAGNVVQQLPMQGVPKGVDTESITWLGGARFALGTEARGERDHDPVLWLHVGATAATVEGSVDLPYSLWSMRARSNDGIEGVCSPTGMLVAGVETAGVEHGRRFAPVGIYDIAGRQWHRARLWLTSHTGKLAGLSCAKQLHDGRIMAWAIERHFGVMRLLRFSVPVNGGDVSGELIADLETQLGRGGKSVANYEGIVHLADGRLQLVADNDYGGITGPTMWLTLRPPP